jgi:hypothetical protein
MLFERLGRHCHSTYVIDPIDFPIVLVLKPHADRPSLAELRPGTSFANGFLNRQPGTVWSFGGRSAGDAVGSQALV